MGPLSLAQTTGTSPSSAIFKTSPSTQFLCADQQKLISIRAPCLNASLNKPSALNLSWYSSLCNDTASVCSRDNQQADQDRAETINKLSRTGQRQSTSFTRQDRDNQQAFQDRAETINKISRTGQRHSTRYPVLYIQDRAEKINMLSSICIMQDRTETINKMSRTEQRHSTGYKGQSENTQQAVQNRAEPSTSSSGQGRDNQESLWCVFYCVLCSHKKYRIVHLVILKNILLCTHILVKVKNGQNSLLINQNTICLDICTWHTLLDNLSDDPIA